MKKVLIGGCSGFLGKALAKHFSSKGYKTIGIIHQNKSEFCDESISWDEIFKNETIPEVDVVLQYSGYPLATPLWTSTVQNKILQSRVDTTAALVRSMVKNPPKTFICGSAIGYYPTAIGGEEQKEYDEEFDGKPANNFAGTLTDLWEKSAHLPPELAGKTRHITTRLGVILGESGGMLPMQKQLFSLGGGATLGNGQQVFPWIHIDDAVKIIEHAAEKENVTGILNLVSPTHDTNADFTELLTTTLSKVPGAGTLGVRLLGSPFRLPEFFLNTILGERSFLLLQGHKIIPKRVEESGYKFKFPTLSEALEDILLNPTN